VSDKTSRREGEVQKKLIGELKRDCLREDGESESPFQQCHTDFPFALGDLDDD